MQENYIVLGIHFASISCILLWPRQKILRSHAEDTFSERIGFILNRSPEKMISGREIARSLSKEIRIIIAFLLCISVTL